MEIGDWDRFTGASIGAYVGLVPSEYSSGASRAQGGITKTGNAHGRRLLSPAYAPGPPVWVFALAAMSGPIRYCGGLAAHRLLRG